MGTVAATALVCGSIRVIALRAAASSGPTQTASSVTAIELSAGTGKLPTTVPAAGSAGGGTEPREVSRPEWQWKPYRWYWRSSRFLQRWPTFRHWCFPAMTAGTDPRAHGFAAATGPDELVAAVAAAIRTATATTAIAVTRQAWFTTAPGPIQRPSAECRADVRGEAGKALAVLDDLSREGIEDGFADPDRDDSLSRHHDQEVQARERDRLRGSVEGAREVPLVGDGLREVARVVEGAGERDVPDLADEPVVVVVEADVRSFDVGREENAEAAAARAERDRRRHDPAGWRDHGRVGLRRAR